MKRHIPLIFLCCLAISGVTAQNLVLKDGRTVPAPKMRRAGETVFVAVQIGTSQGEAGLPFASIARADFPSPPQLSTATDLAAQGKYDEALSALAPAVELFQPIPDLPGSWWPQLALLKAEAQEKTGHAAESQTLLEQVVRSSKDPASVEIARLRLTRRNISQGKFGEAQAACEAVLAKDGIDGAIAAEAWLRSGDIQLAQRQFEPALLAYLHVPALHARQTAAMPAALLGSARAYIALKEDTHATEALNELVQQFPSTAEAKAAAEELKHLAKPEPESNP